MPFANNPHAVYNGLISGQRNMFLTSSIAVAMVGFSNTFKENNVSGAGPLDVDEFLVVAVDGSGEATEGWFLKGGKMFSGLDSQRDLLAGKRPQQVTLSDFNTFNTAFEKNLDQAITAITIANTKINYYSDYSTIAANTSPALE